MKTILKTIGLIGLVALLDWEGKSQGFVNLNFESSNLTGYPQASVVPAASAFPGWAVTAPFITYDAPSLSGNSISIFDTIPPYGGTPIQGAYFAFLASGNTPGLGQTISLEQTGTIPVGTQSITFWGNIGGLQVSFDGQMLSFMDVSNALGYSVYASDISPFAGQTGELLFSLPPYVSSSTLDNIQFSTSAVPEPSTLALGGLLFVVWHNRRIFSKA